MNYANPPSTPSPFLTTPPIVMVVRHVRITPSGDVVAEDSNALPRHLRRIDQTRVFPRPLAGSPVARNIPEHGMRKKDF